MMDVRDMGKDDLLDFLETQEVVSEEEERWMTPHASGTDFTTLYRLPDGQGVQIARGGGEVQDILYLTADEVARKATAPR